jgi:hypothetical protein
MTILQIAVILFLFYRALRIQPEPALRRARSRGNSQVV